MGKREELALVNLFTNYTFGRLNGPERSRLCIEGLLRAVPGWRLDCNCNSTCVTRRVQGRQGAKGLLASAKPGKRAERNIRAEPTIAFAVAVLRPGVLAPFAFRSFAVQPFSRSAVPWLCRYALSCCTLPSAGWSRNTVY